MKSKAHVCPMAECDVTCVVCLLYGGLDTVYSNSVNDSFSLPSPSSPSPCSTEDCQLKALLILAKGVHYLTSRQLQNTFANFLLGGPGSADNHVVYRALLTSLDHLSEEICYAALHLFDALLGLSNEGVVLRLLEVGHVTSHVTSSEDLQWKKCVWAEERGKMEMLVNQ